MFWFKKRTIKLFVFSNQKEHLSNKVLRKLIGNNNKNHVHLILASTNQNLNQEYETKLELPGVEFTVFHYPTNRQIEKHLLLAQHISKYSNHNFQYFTNNSVFSKTSKFLNNKNGVEIEKIDESYSVFHIVSNKFMSKILKKNRINQLRDFLSEESS